jgi:hypothetical protein
MIANNEERKYQMKDWTNRADDVLPDRPPLWAGAAKTQITPPLGGVLQSGMTLTSEGVLDDLYSTAIVLDDGATRVALVGNDIIYMEAPLAAEIRERIAEQTGISGDNVLLNASHTHSGPNICVISPYTIDMEYREWLIQKIVDTVVRAEAALEPVSLSIGEAEGMFAVNRRRMVNGKSSMLPNYDATVDNRARVLRFDRLDGSVLAIVFSMACHGTGFNYRGIPVIGGDYISPAKDEIERSFAAEGAPLAIFLAGCGGNIRPRVIAPDGERFHPCTEAEIQAHGRGAGAVAVRAARESHMAVGYPIAVAREQLPLPFQVPPSIEELRAFREESPDGRWVKWADYLIAKLENGEQLPETVDMEIQVVRLGGVCIVAMGGEVFVEIGLAIERALQESNQAQMALTLGYSNSEVGYVCTASSYPEGGSEPVGFYRWFWYPAPFKPETEEYVVRRALELARQVV